MASSDPTRRVRTGAGSFLQLVRERRTRDALYHAPTYWDARASAREGLARSMWPSNVFNALWDARQREVLARALGDVRGRRIVDVGCGTGRMTRFLADLGADALGIDFSPATIEAARADSPVSATFAVGDVLGALDDAPGAGSFDDAVVLGCLSVACRDGEALARALGNVARLVRHDGRVILLEPIHRSPLLRRILRLGVEEWIAAANAVGLLLIGTDRMGFAPARLVLSVRDLPRSLVTPLFAAGEAALEWAPYLGPFADYKLLAFRRGGRA